MIFQQISDFYQYIPFTGITYSFFDSVRNNFITWLTKLLQAAPLWRLFFLILVFFIVTAFFILYPLILHIDSVEGQNNPQPSREGITPSSTRVSRGSGSGRDDTDNNNNTNANTFNPAANVPTSSTPDQLSGKELLKAILEDDRDLLDSIDPQTGLTYYEVTWRILGSRSNFDN